MVHVNASLIMLPRHLLSVHFLAALFTWICWLFGPYWQTKLYDSFRKQTGQDKKKSQHAWQTVNKNKWYSTLYFLIHLCGNKRRWWYCRAFSGGKKSIIYIFCEGDGNVIYLTFSDYFILYYIHAKVHFLKRKNKI